MHIELLERIQSFAARVVTTGIWSHDHESAGLKAKLQWPSLQRRRLCHKLSLCHRIISGSSIIPLSFFLMAPRRCASHKNSMPQFWPHIRTLHHRHSFKWSIVDHWNKVPEELASLSSTAALRRRIKSAN